MPVDKMEASVLVTRAYWSHCDVDVRPESFPPDLQTNNTIKVNGENKIVEIYQQKLFILSVNI